MQRSRRKAGESPYLAFERNRVSRLLHLSDAAFTRCDVLKWEDQVAMFDLALSSFGSVDVVVRGPNPQ